MRLVVVVPFFLMQTVLIGWQSLGAAETAAQDRQLLCSSHTAGNDFSSDPGWIGVRNQRPLGPGCKPVIQDYGYSRSHHVGSGFGELGGVASRSLTQSYYGDASVGDLSLDDALRIKGKLACTDGSDGAVFIGFFNTRDQAYRAQNFLGMAFQADKGKLFGQTAYTTADWGSAATGKGSVAFVEMGSSNGEVHTFDISYDPHVGDGRISILLDGHRAFLDLSAEHRAQGAQFNRFGLFHMARAASAGGKAEIEIYFDDLTYTTSDGMKTETFDRDPSWDAKKMPMRFSDCEFRGNHDFGYKNGKIGGLFFKEDSQGPTYYADAIAKRTEESVLEASGTIQFVLGNSDGGMQFGWFSSNFEPGAGKGERSLLGIHLEGPSRIGHYFAPEIKTEAGGRHRFDHHEKIRLRPDGEIVPFRIRYDPAANEGNGLMTVTLGEQTVEYRVPAGVKAERLELDRFGLLPVPDSGSAVRVFFDNLSYTGASDRDESR